MSILWRAVRWGTTLTQLMLNANPNLFAPQELYLLHFYTMGERRRRLAGPELEGWVFEAWPTRKCSKQKRRAARNSMSEGWRMTVSNYISSNIWPAVLAGAAQGGDGAAGVRGEAVQAESMKPVPKAPGTNRFEAEI
jgi:hypothetical protein